MKSQIFSKKIKYFFEQQEKINIHFEKKISFLVKDDIFIIIFLNRSGARALFVIGPEGLMRVSGRMGVRAQGGCGAPVSGRSP